MPIKTFKLENAKHLAALIIIGLFCTILAGLAVKWCLGNAIATSADSKELAEFTTRLAPADPQTHYALAVLSDKTFLPGDFEKSLAGYEQAAALSPGDYLLWLELGKARERSGDAPGAENALRKALALAPNYSQIHWTLGNALVRQGKTEEGFAFIRRAAEGDDKFVNPAIATAWQLSGGDLDLVMQSAGDAPKLKAALAVFLAGEKRFDQAMQIWNALPESEKRTSLKESGVQIYNRLLAEKRFRDALAVQAGINDAQDFAVGRINNGDFETNVKAENAGLFEWQIAPGLQPQVGIDDQQRRSGNQSLVIVFNSADGKEFRQISQTIAVEAVKSYRLEAFYKSDLKAPATLQWEIADAADGKVLAATDTVAEKADWTSLETDFTIPENVQAIVIWLTRADCKSPVCPIYGRVWFDDLTLRQK